MLETLDVSNRIPIFAIKYKPMLPMKRIYTLIFVFCILGFFAQAKSQANFQVNIASAKKYLEMAQKAVGGDMPTDTDWEALFASDAYSELLQGKMG